jgi:hypothetical protein
MVFIFPLPFPKNKVGPIPFPKIWFLNQILGPRSWCQNSVFTLNFGKGRGSLNQILGKGRMHIPCQNSVFALISQKTCFL